MFQALNIKGTPLHCEDKVKQGERIGVILSLPEPGKAQVAFIEAATGLPEIVDSVSLETVSSIIEDIKTIRTEEDVIALLKRAEEMLAAKLATKKKAGRKKKGEGTSTESTGKEDVDI